MNLPTLCEVLVALQPELEGKTLSGAHFERWGMPLFGGCVECGASIAAHNAVAGRHGYLLGTCCATKETALSLDEAVALYRECEQKPEGQ